MKSDKLMIGAMQYRIHVVACSVLDVAGKPLAPGVCCVLLYDKHSYLCHSTERMRSLMGCEKRKYGELAEGVGFEHLRSQEPSIVHRLIPGRLRSGACQKK